MKQRVKGMIACAMAAAFALGTSYPMTASAEGGWQKKLTYENVATTKSSDEYEAIKTNKVLRIKVKEAGEVHILVEDNKGKGLGFVDVMSYKDINKLVPPYVSDNNFPENGEDEGEPQETSEEFTLKLKKGSNDILVDMLDSKARSFKVTITSEKKILKKTKMFEMEMARGS